MNKMRKNIEDVFKTASLAGTEQSEPVFSAGWQGGVMSEVRRIARSSNVIRNEDAPLNLFALRMGWAMLGLALSISVVFYFVGMHSLKNTRSASSSSLWEFVDQSVNSYDVILFDKTGNSERTDVK